MKKTFLSLLALIAGVSLSIAQQRCGTTEYYQKRLKEDPSLAQRIAQQEVYIQQWISDHPQTTSKLATTPRYPELAGFKATGDPIKDAAEYRAAKEAWLQTHPLPAAKKPSEEEILQMRASHKVTITNASK
jgi:hypothetical protein